MKALWKVLVLAVALVVAFAGVVRADALTSSLSNPWFVKNVAGTLTSDTLAFKTLIADGTHVTSTHTSSDTLSVVTINNVAYTQNSNGATTSAVVDMIRLTAWGMAGLITTDTLFAFTDFANSPSGPWLSQSKTSFTPLVVAGLAGAADTTGAGYAAANRALLTSLPNGGITAWSGYVSRKFDGVVPTDPLGWKYMRIRLAGDANGPVWLTSFDVSVPTTVLAVPRQ